MADIKQFNKAKLFINNELLKKFPNSSRVYERIGRMYRLMKDYKTSKKYYELAIIIQ